YMGLQHPKVFQEEIGKEFSPLSPSAFPPPGTYRAPLEAHKNSRRIALIISPNRATDDGKSQSIRYPEKASERFFRRMDQHSPFVFVRLVNRATSLDKRVSQAKWSVCEIVKK
ncbi:hypothetical protein BaRGS_00028894, partial [Batillaria attramentaria]